MNDMYGINFAFALTGLEFMFDLCIWRCHMLLLKPFQGYYNKEQLRAKAIALSIIERFE